MLTAGQLRREISCAAFALGGWVLLWWPLLFADRHLHVRDLMRFALPSKMFLFDALADLRWPLWTPWLGAGQPWLADMAHQAFYPGNLAYLLPAAVGASANGALDVYLLSHSLLALLGMRVLLGTLGLVRVAAWALALVYAASGVLVSLMDNVTYLPGAGWLPLALATLPRVAQSRGALCAAAVSMAMLVLAGDLLDLGVLLLVAPLLLWPVAGDATAAARLLRAVAWCLALGAGLAAAQWLPTLDLLAQGSRVKGLTLEVSQAWSLPPARLWEWVSPFVFGAKYPLREVLLPALYPHAGTPWFESIYLGVIPVALALAGLCSRRPGCARWGLVLLLVTLLALGRHTPLYEAARALLPLLDTQRYPEKLALWMTLCLVVMAGFGTRALLAAPRRARLPGPRRDLLLRLAASLALPLLLAMLLAEWPVSLLAEGVASTPSAYWHGRLGFPASWLQGALLHALALALCGVALLWLARWRARAACRGLLLLAALDLLWIHAGHAPSLPAPLLDAAPPPAVLEILGPASGARVHVDPSPPDYAAMPPGAVHRLVDSFHAGELAATLAGAQWTRSTLLDRERLAADGNVALGVPLLDTGFAPLAPELQERRLQAAQAGDVALLAEAAVTHVLAPASRETHWRAAGLPLVYTDAASDLWLFEVPAPRPWASFDPSPASLSARRQQGRLLVEVATSRAGRLVLRESWHPGWRARQADGSGVEVRRGPAGMLALDLTAGEHRIELVYVERLLPAGLALSAVTLLALLLTALGVVPPRRRRRGL